jgi:hemerythrin-like metal-binding protein
MALITWQPQFSVGIKEFDDDHKKLIELINALWTANRDRRNSSMGPILDELAKYVSCHFRREEQLFQTWEFPGAAHHGESHAKLETTVSRLVEKFRHEPVLAADVFEFLREWLIKHILGEDMIYASYFRALGLDSVDAVGSHTAPMASASRGPLLVAASGIAGMIGLALAAFGQLGGGSAMALTGTSLAAGAMGLLIWRGSTGSLGSLSLLTESLKRLSVRDWTLPSGADAETGPVRAPLFYVRVLAGMLHDLVEKNAQAEDILKAAEQEARGSLLEMTNELEQAIGGTVADVTQRSSHLASIAGTMREHSASLGERNRSVAEAAKSATANVDAVAQSATDLLNSIREMQDETRQSRQIAEDAAAESRRTSDIVASLAEASRQIGDIVGVIDTIARQTNMLALNATIEAARAGEAGKGFAVVAGEVKGLAHQTTQATGRIHHLVETIQGAVGQAVDAIQRVDEVVGRIGTVSVKMSDTTAHQAGAAETITEMARQAAHETVSVTQTMSRISETATEAEQLSSIVLSTVGSVSSEVVALQQRLIETLRGSFAGNRRRHERVEVDMGAIITADGTRMNGRVRDISISGALFHPEHEASMAEGQQVRFFIDGLDNELTAEVVRISDKGCHLQFLVDTKTQQRIGGWLALIAPEAGIGLLGNAELGNNVELF